MWCTRRVVCVDTVTVRCASATCVQAFCVQCTYAAERYTLLHLAARCHVSMSVVPIWECVWLQIDINPFSEEGWAFTQASLTSLCVNGGANLIRLDAFGYVTKKAGTNCFMEVCCE